MEDGERMGREEESERVGESRGNRGE